MKTRKNVILWIIYDFANSIVSVVFFLYFAQWIVIDRGLSDLSFNLTFTISTIFLLFSVPLAGLYLDQNLRRITGLRWNTAGTAILYGGCALSAISNNNILAIIFFTAGIYMYQLTFTFYTPLINDITVPEKIGRISGYGIGANYLGQFVGLLIALPFSNSTLNLFHASARAETLIPSVIMFIIFALPMLIFFNEPKTNKIKPEQCSILNQLIFKTKKIFIHPGIWPFILSYFLFNDAVLTTMNNFPIILEQIWEISDSAKTFTLLGIISTSAIGGFISGIIADKYGHKKTMIVILIGWIFIFPFIGLISNITVLVIASCFMGLWFGSSWAVSRSVMSYLVPANNTNLAFSYFNLIERTSSLIGPVIWGLIVSGFLSLGSFRYRLAILSMTVFIILGLWTMNKVRSDR